MECESHFEELVRNGADPECPDCGAAKVRKQFSVFAAHGTAEQPSFGGARPGAAVAAEPVAAASAEPSTLYARRRVAACTRCRLAEGRTQVVFGVGDPRRRPDVRRRGARLPRGQAGLPVRRPGGEAARQAARRESGSTRDDVYIANVLKCRPPGNRDPQPDEIEACEAHLFRQVELIEPKLVATLGNFATKLLSGKQLGITRVHGQEQEVTLGGRSVLLYPIYHPAAALYTPRDAEVLEEDFRAAPGAARPRQSRLRRSPRRVLVARARRPAGPLLGSRPWSTSRPRPRRPSASPPASPPSCDPGTSSRSRASSAPGRRPSSAAPAGRSVSTAR